jgi:hypothetical protein
MDLVVNEELGLVAQFVSCSVGRKNFFERQLMA